MFSNKLQKYTENTTVTGLIQDGDEPAYRHDVEQPVHWCSQNHLQLNPLKTVEIIKDCRRSSPVPPNSPSCVYCRYHLISGIPSSSGLEVDLPESLYFLWIIPEHVVTETLSLFFIMNIVKLKQSLLKVWDLTDFQIFLRASSSLINFSVGNEPWKTSKRWR